MCLIDRFRESLSLFAFDEAEELAFSIKRSNLPEKLKLRVEIEYFLATSQFQYAAFLIKKFRESNDSRISFSFVCLMLRCLYLASKCLEARSLVESVLSDPSCKEGDAVVLLSIMVEFDDDYVVNMIHSANIGFGVKGQFSSFKEDRAPLCSDRVERVFNRQQRFIFVGGTPRSGTSALGVFLNRHSDIAMTVERYGYVQGFHPNMFEHDQLCRGKGIADKEKFREKVENATFLGDKRPNFLFGWFLTRKNFSPEEIKIVHLTRDPYLVAESYNKRAILQAEGSGSWGSWPYSPRNQVYAVRDMNINNKYVKEIKKDNLFQDSLLVADSSEVYSSERKLIEIVDWMGLPVTKEVKEKAKAVVQKSKHYKAKEKYSKSTYEYVNKNLDWCLFDSVLEYRDL